MLSFSIALLLIVLINTPAISQELSCEHKLAAADEMISYRARSEQSMVIEIARLRSENQHLGNINNLMREKIEKLEKSKEASEEKK